MCVHEYIFMIVFFSFFILWFYHTPPCVSVCVCGLCVCVCLCISICPRVCVCLGDGEGTHTCALQDRVELRGGCKVSCSITLQSMKTDCLTVPGAKLAAANPRDPVSSPTALGLQVCVTMTSFWHVRQGAKLRTHTYEVSTHQPLQRVALNLSDLACIFHSLLHGILPLFRTF